ncbi:MAG: glycosyltransferase [Candidatus Atelocyanobacterium thalassa isolate SIO64986]|uniref:Glycosyltransferase n=1 Tax=Candidatus Atelocyanobacterium thalassa isolate SIO64986 TaxID=1527444 RepID=A0A086CIG2_9CHRO|nr:MAG: glycosyltransferase [Candidatus Atelocyanobacterium thalassa isolate SIO64986]
MLKLLFLSTPVGPLGSGVGGGVELTLFNLAKEMNRRGHQVKIVAPQHSSLPNITCQEIPGVWQDMVQNSTRDAPIILLQNSVLANMWNFAKEVENDYDLIVNFAFDWLPLYLTPFFKRTIAHLISMGSTTDAIDSMIHQVAKSFPYTIGIHTQEQAKTFPFLENFYILGNGIDISLYEFCDNPSNDFSWIGRISPEKGLEDAILAAKGANVKLKVFGKIQDIEYWKNIQVDYSNADFQYEGFFSTEKLQEKIRTSKAILVTPKWVEAFGNVIIESLACGVPVIAYKRGGPAALVKHGETGFLVTPDSVNELVYAINNIGEINRERCRHQAEINYSLQVLGDRFEKWMLMLNKINKSK